MPSPPSPSNRSPRRRALTSKDANVGKPSRLARPLKPRTLLSVTATTAPVTLARLESTQVKASLKLPRGHHRLPTFALKHTTFQPTLTFEIFNDPNDYASEIEAASNLVTYDENDPSIEKENTRHWTLHQRVRAVRSRSVLEDLDIAEFQGYVTFFADELVTQTETGTDAQSPPVLREVKLMEVNTEGPAMASAMMTTTTAAKARKGAKYRLDTVWRRDKARCLPSYVTPPRGVEGKVKFICFGEEESGWDDTDKKKLGRKRSGSVSDLNVDSCVRKLVFDIHKD